VVALQRKLELKWKYLAEFIAGKLLRAGTLKEDCSGVRSLQVSVPSYAWNVVKHCISILLSVLHFFIG
jgi:hypothetical protein